MLRGSPSHIQRLCLNALVTDPAEPSHPTSPTEVSQPRPETPWSRYSQFLLCSLGTADPQNLGVKFGGDLLCSNR